MEIANPEHPNTAPASFHDKFFPMHISGMRPRSARPPPTTFATSSPKLALVPLLWPSIFVLLLALRSLRSIASVPPLTPSVCAMELPTLNNSKPRSSYYSLVRFYWNEQIGLKFDMTPHRLPHSLDLSLTFHRSQENSRRAALLTNYSVTLTTVYMNIPTARSCHPSFTQNHKATRQKSMNHPNHPWISSGLSQITLLFRGNKCIR